MVLSILVVEELIYFLGIICLVVWNEFEWDLICGRMFLVVWD